MTLQEAVRRADADSSVWIRPVVWRGTGQAVSFVDNVAHVVPGKRGGRVGMPTHVIDLVCDWEAVEPAFVCGENLPREQEKVSAE